MKTLMKTSLWLPLAAFLFGTPAFAGKSDPWPMSSGPHGNYLPLQPEGIEYVDDLADAKLLWESKCDHFGWIKTTSGMMGTIYKDHLSGHPGSGSTPIIAEGKVFGSSFRATGPVDQGRAVEKFLKGLQERKGAVDPKRAEFLRKSVRFHAEDVVFALDADTGKLLWETFESGGVNLAAGKRDIWKPSPVYLDGKLFTLGTTGMIRAYDAKTGKKLWETTHPLMREKILADVEKAKNSEGYGRYRLTYQFERDLFAVDGRVIVPSFGDPVGLDAETGKVLWQLQGEKSERIQNTFSNPGLWKHGNKTYLLYAGRAGLEQGRLFLVDPTDGRILHRLDVGMHTNGVTIVGDVAFVSVANQTLPRVRNGKTETKTQALMGGVRLSLDGLQLLWSLPKGEVKYAYVITPDRGVRRHAAAGANGTILYHAQGGSGDQDTDRLFVLVAKSGKILAESDLPKCCSPYPYQIGKRVLVFRDGSHKTNNAKLFSLPDLNLLTEDYKWKHFGTTTYELNLEHPIVDGRIYMRTGNGTLACYDLRKE